MTPGLPLHLGFTPDDALIDHLAEMVIEHGFNHALAKSVVKQLLQTVTVDFINGAIDVGGNR